MRTIEVCIGSACHLKGSCQVIRKLQALITENGMADQIELKSAFCLGVCGRDVSVRMDGGTVESVSPASVDRYFAERVLEGGHHEVHRIQQA